MWIKTLWFSTRVHPSQLKGLHLQCLFRIQPPRRPHETAASLSCFDNSIEEAIPAESQDRRNQTRRAIDLAKCIVVALVKFIRRNKYRKGIDAACQFSLLPVEEWSSLRTALDRFLLLLLCAFDELLVF